MARRALSFRGVGSSDDQHDGVANQSEREQNYCSDGMKSCTEYAVGLVAGGRGRGGNRRGGSGRRLRRRGGGRLALAGTCLNDHGSGQGHCQSHYWQYPLLHGTSVIANVPATMFVTNHQPGEQVPCPGDRRKLSVQKRGLSFLQSQMKRRASPDSGLVNVKTAKLKPWTI